MLIAPIVTEAEYEQALGEIRRLVALEPDRGSPAGDRLEALTALAETFEAERFVLDLADIDAR
jgi:antitoxin component HigA of HigAB toxin-antitoxin module